MILLNRETRKFVSMVGANGDLNEAGRVRLTRELFCERYHPGQRVRLKEIATNYGLDNDAVLKLFREFESLGLVTLSGKFSAIIHSPNAKEMHEAYEIRAGLEEIAGRTAAEALKGNTAALQRALDTMRVAVSSGDLDGYAEHDPTSTGASSKLRETASCCGFGKPWRSTFEFGFQSAKCRRSFPKLLSLTNRSSMHSRTVAREKAAFCCATMSKPLPSISRKRILTREFTRRFARIWKARRRFNEPFSRPRASRFPVYPVRSSISPRAESEATITTFYPSLAGAGVLRSGTYLEKELAPLC